MDKKKYIEHREQVIEALNKFEMYLETYKAFDNKFLRRQEVRERFNGYELTILEILNEELLFNTLLSMRKLISIGQSEKSLSSLHFHNASNSETSNQNRSKEENLEKILPNSLEQYKIWGCTR
jgi:hypothetical protein